MLTGGVNWVRRVRCWSFSLLRSLFKELGECGGDGGPVLVILLGRMSEGIEEGMISRLGQYEMTECLGG